MNPAIFETARRNMVEYQIRCCKILEPSLLDMLESMPREEYLPAHLKSLAYMEGHVPLPCNQEMLSPLQEAQILDALKLEGNERVLEIGTGTGFLTTLLAMQAEAVVSCELHPELAALARGNLQVHGVTNAEIIEVNAMDSAAFNKAVQGKFDVIVVGASLKELPQHLLDKLNDGGQVIAFIGQNPVVCLSHQRYEGPACIQKKITETLLQDMEGLPEKREFVF